MTFKEDRQRVRRLQIYKQLQKEAIENFERDLKFWKTRLENKSEKTPYANTELNKIIKSPAYGFWKVLKNMIFRKCQNTINIYELKSYQYIGQLTMETTILVLINDLPEKLRIIDKLTPIKEINHKIRDEWLQIEITLEIISAQIIDEIEEDLYIEYIDFEYELNTDTDLWNIGEE